MESQLVAKQAMIINLRVRTHAQEQQLRTLSAQERLWLRVTAPRFHARPHAVQHA